MDILLFVFVILFYFPTVSSDKYEVLPPVYKMEDYPACVERSDSYCKLDIWLINNGNENNPLWKLINESINDKYKYDRNVIHRAICVPKNESFNLESIKNFSELHINEELKETNLIGLVKGISCTTKDKSKISSYDFVILLSFTTYFLLIGYATMKDNQKRKLGSESLKDKMITSLSLTSNWKKIWRTEGNQHFNRLKSIQGIRFYNMLLVMSAHTVLASIILYITNPEAIEELFTNSIIQIISSMTILMVQPFLLISSWILTFQIYMIYQYQGKFTVRHAFALFINRFLRTGVCSTIMILLVATSWNRYLDGPLTFDNNELTQENCRLNGWRTFFFIHNFLLFGEMCHPSTWFLGVDFQLYIVTLITMYFILKYKLNEWKVISFLMIFSCLLYGSIIYFNGMSTVPKLNANTMRKHNFLVSNEIRVLYTSPYSSWTVSLVGMLMGIMYTKNEHRNIDNKVISLLWLLMFFGLPIAAGYITTFDIQGIPAAISGALIKPMFCLGIGIGILGMSYNIGGPIKFVFENKYVVVMSNFAYSAYLCQFPVIFLKGTGTHSLATFETSKVIKYILFFDAPMSVLLGIICSLIFELPGSNLQKILFQRELKNLTSQKHQ